MTTPAAQANATKRVQATSLHKDFGEITITGYYTRDIRFPVIHILIEDVNVFSFLFF